ncbi:hypothetical protein L596_026486 [Steinernema carpocapsae]|uniref:Uncharacterized protein n=1 Tax=Steinernema carpocapsae TaxID=34508 RepID=A0A4U5M1K7_STECR|nr:hypothetical protein L596_026486 [Steinernema carpocapsae]
MREEPAVKSASCGRRERTLRRLHYRYITHFFPDTRKNKEFLSGHVGFSIAKSQQKSRKKRENGTKDLVGKAGKTYISPSAPPVEHHLLVLFSNMKASVFALFCLLAVTYGCAPNIPPLDPDTQAENDLKAAQAAQEAADAAVVEAETKLANIRKRRDEAKQKAEDLKNILSKLLPGNRLKRAANEYANDPRLQTEEGIQEMLAELEQLREEIENLNEQEIKAVKEVTKAKAAQKKAAEKLEKAEEKFFEVTGKEPSKKPKPSFTKPPPIGAEQATKATPTINGQTTKTIIPTETATKKAGTTEMVTITATQTTTGATIADKKATTTGATTTTTANVVTTTSQCGSNDHFCEYDHGRCQAMNKPLKLLFQIGHQ